MSPQTWLTSSGVTNLSVSDCTIHHVVSHCSFKMLSSFGWAWSAWECQIHGSRTEYENGAISLRAGANSGPELELLANSNSGIGIGIELAFPSLTGIGIELELPVFELEFNWNCHNWNWSRNCVLRNRIRNCFPWNWNPIQSPSYPYLQ